MLKGIDPILSPDLLKILMEMGHDEAIVFVDANFTAMSVAAGKPIVRLPGIGLMQVLRAVSALMPLEAGVVYPVGFMGVCGEAVGYRSALHREVVELVTPELSPHQSVESIERYAFYDRARKAYAIVITGELQPYGNVIMRKGVICEKLRA